MDDDRNIVKPDPLRGPERKEDLLQAAGPLLEVRGLKKHFAAPSGWFRGKGPAIRAVEDVSFSIDERDTMALVGESGCGKSTTARCIVRLIEPTAGSVLFDGCDLLTLAPEAMRRARRHIQMVYQDPYGSLNPRMTVEDLLAEPLRTHGLGDRRRIERDVLDMLDRIGLSRTHRTRYPHQFSGGQRQRIGIGRALIARPRLILADEPVSALDVSIQSQILNLLMDLQEEMGLTMLFISHDLNVVRHVSRKVGVMYLGELVERAPTAELYAEPLHPYTRALLDSVPACDPSRRKRRAPLEGDALSPLERPEGCPFVNRCPQGTERCRTDRPPLAEPRPGHFVRCHLWRTGTDPERKGLGRSL